MDSPNTLSGAPAPIVNLAPPPLRDLVAASFRVGCLGFGGPAGQIALMHRVFVDEKKWIDEPRFLSALNYCMLLPGPEAQQLATYIGWLLHGVRGGVVAGALFVLPGAVIVFALSWIYAEYGATPLVGAAFFGIKAAVLAFVAEALVKIGRRALKSRLDVAFAVAGFLLLYCARLPFPVIVLGAAALGAVLLKASPAASLPATTLPSGRGAAVAALIWGAAWLTPLALVLATVGPDHVLGEIGLLFSSLAVVTFGGAYAVLAHLQAQAVDVHGWLTAGQMIDGLGLAETTPGPLILVNQFVGFLAGWRDGGLPLAAAAAALASWCTFAPSFLFIFAGAPYAEALRRSRIAAAALRGVTASVLGVIASLSLWFGQAVLFRERIEVTPPWGSGVSLPDLASLDLGAVTIALAAGVLLIRMKTNPVLVVAGSALAGLLLSQI